MKYFLPFILAIGLITMTSCEKKETRLLDDLAGTYRIDQVHLVPEIGADTTFVPDVQLTFSDCDLETNRLGGNCSLEVNSSHSFTLTYAIEKGSGQTDPTMRINPGATPSDIADGIAYQILSGVHNYQLSNGTLTMTTSSRDNLFVRIDNRNYLLREVIATRQ